MSRIEGPLATTEWLAAHLGDAGVKLVDGSWYLPAEQRDPKAEYVEGHLPGAVYFDIDAISDTASPLSHMFPDASTFADAVGALDIADDDHVICYDGGSMSAAGRVWWMFRAFGHEAVQVLDGGARKWRAEGRAWTAEPVTPAPRTYRGSGPARGVRALEDVLGVIERGGEQILDARTAARFAGTAPEPRAGMRSGHMPGAYNLPYTDLLAADGTLLAADLLAAKFEASGIDLQHPVITSCGSGVSATVLLLGLEVLGRPGTLYDGSWSEWGGREDTPVAR
jgi:thiosulfate/3-mercaptopyruvate sulfurtransferase